MKKGYGKTALFLTAMLWGSTFAIGKIATEVYSASFIIALRFTVANLALIFVAFPLRKLIDKQYLVDGFWMGFSLFLSYILQVAGLAMDTSPGKSAFLCTTYCVMVPFMHWFATKKKPQVLHVLCVFLCLLGIGILSLRGGLGMSTGDILTVLSGVPCAVNIVVSSCGSTCVDLCVVYQYIPERVSVKYSRRDCIFRLSGNSTLLVSSKLWT